MEMNDKSLSPEGNLENLDGKINNPNNQQTFDFDIPDSEDTPGALQNLDEVIDKAIKGNGGKTSEEIANEEKLKQQSQQAGNLVDGLFDFFGKKYGDQFKKPENVTEENLVDWLASVMKPVYDKNLSPEAIRFNDFIKEGGSPKDYFETHFNRPDFTKMSDDDLLMMHFKTLHGVSEERPDGATDEDIKEHISKFSKLDKIERADQLRKALKEEDEKMLQEDLEARRNEAKENTQKIVDSLKESVKSIIPNVLKIKDVMGINVSEKDHNDFLPVFEKMILPGEDGISPAQKIINNDLELYKLLYLVHKSGNSKNFLKDLQTQEVKDLKDKLGLKPNDFGGSGEQKDSDMPNLDKWSMPDTSHLKKS